MNIFISGIVYDGGKSGISEYTHSLTNALAKQQRVTIALLKKDIPIFPVKHENITIFEVSNIFGNPILSILWHLILVPFYAHSQKSSNIILPAANRRLTFWTGKPTLGIVHDLSQYHVASKYGLFRTFYVKHVLPIMIKSLGTIVAISHCTRKDIVDHWGIEEQ